MLEAASVLSQQGALDLGRGEVHAWALELGSDAEVIARCADLLSPGEAARAARFHFPVHRDRFIVAHGLLRHVLARYAGIDARSVAFETAPEGKPSIAGAEGGLSFNLSHSHERALLAVSDGRDLGADVEQERDEVDMLGIAGAYFYRSEMESIRSAVDAERLRARFFRYWVAKESVLKGEGCGLGFPLDKFEVVFDSSDTAATVVSLDPQRVRSDWTIRMLSLGPGWPAAVAARGTDWRVVTAA